LQNAHAVSKLTLDSVVPLLFLLFHLSPRVASRSPYIVLAIILIKCNFLLAKVLQIC
jgi:hypothetical protein